MTHDVASESPARTFWRFVVVIGLAAYVLGLTLPNLFTDLNGLPITIDGQYRITSVFGSASAAGLQVGDTVDFAACGLKQRMELAGDYLLARNERMVLPVIRGSRRFSVTLSASFEEGSWNGLTFIKRTAATAFVITAAVLLLRRPSRMLWGFFLYAIGSVEGSALFYESIPIGIYVVLMSSLTMLYAVNPIGLWIFASRFPKDESGGWRRYADRLALPVLVALLALNGWTIVQTIVGIPPWDLVYIDIGLQTIGLLCMLDAYIHLRAQDRQRLKWVLAGMAVFYAGFAYQQMAGELPGGGWPTAWSNAGWTPDVLAGLQVFIPLTVAYAVLKHRVIDVNFVMSRALVYGLVTSVLIGVFALVDWFLTKTLAERQVAAFVEIVAALALGFSLNAMHKFVDGLVDRVLFRQRHLAEVRLERAAAGVRHVSAASAIDETLTEEPVDALGLTSAAVFRFTDGASFERTRAVGWSGAAAQRIDANDPLVQNIQGERGMIRLRETRRTHSPMPDGTAAPAIAVPLFVRHVLEGFVLYGAHAGGEDFDPVEIGLLERLAAAAAATYDHLDAEAARRDAERLQHELREAQSTIASLQTQPAR